jgi:hypothetical protein
LNWLLPWLALTAQLPFETGRYWNDLICIFVSLGSPATIVYSLTITLLNRYWIRGRFNKLRDQHNRLEAYIPDHLLGVIDCMEIVLREAQQIPIRLSQGWGRLSSGILLKENMFWWNRVRTDVLHTRRGYSFSLFAQMLLAITAYVFTVITSFISIDGNDIGPQLAGGGIYIWMIPVIWGWIICGTQASASSISEALNDPLHPFFRAPILPSEVGPLIDLDERNIASQRACIQCESGVISCPLAIDGSKGPLSPRKSYIGRVLEPAFLHPWWFGFCAEGDEACQGPLFNFARVFTWRQSVTIVEEAFSNVLIKSEVVSPLDHPDIRGRVIAETCGLTAPLNAYVAWSHIDPETWYRIIIACFMALFVQWGTAGPAVMIPYLTPVRGLGCRSGTFLLYGMGGTIVWMLLLISSFLSHEAMIRHQTLYHESLANRAAQQNGIPLLPWRRPDEEHDHSLHHHHHHYHRHKSFSDRSLSTSIITALAVITRLFAKVIAAINTGNLILSAVLDYLGVYQNCWCKTNSLSRGTHGWLILFEGQDDTTMQGVVYDWVLGVVISFVVALVATVLFYLGSLDRGTRSRERVRVAER